jgi:integrase/recombinase XerD
LKRVQGRSPAYVRLLTAALRSFLRFLHRHGDTPTDLSRAVPVVRTCRQASVHSYVSPQDIERILSTPDPSIRCSRRDHAVLLLLARLGLRAGEVVTLNLEDILWRTGEIVVRGKGRTVDRIPLLSDVGAALARYISTDRGDSRSRRVFLRASAPKYGFVGPAAIDGIVRKAFARAGVVRPGRGAAHLFRHSLATRMIRHGASMTEISEVLRHRSLDATQIYAKVAFEALRAVAQPWPGCGGPQ